MAEITINREPGTTLTMDSAERALLDEIEVKSQPPPVSHRPRPPPQPMQISQAGIDVFTNPNKRVSFKRHSPPREEQEEEYIEDDGYGAEEEFAHEGPSEPVPSAGYSCIEDEKADLLNKLSRLEKKGFKTSGKLNAYSEIEQIRTEYKRIIFQIESDQGIKFARRVLMACVTGVEFLNKKFDPFDIQLDGWSENMMENVEEYDTVFEELHAKYKDKVAVAPEIKLMMMVGGSAMMFHLTKSMFKSAGLDTSKVLRDNPDLLKNMMDAVKKSQEQEPPPPPNDTGRREMRGPGIDIGSMMSGFMPPPQPMNTREPSKEPVAPPPSVTDSEVSDIISTTSDTKDVTIRTGKKGASKKKKEVTI
jgi:hypothetical protein